MNLPTSKFCEQITHIYGRRVFPFRSTSSIGISNENQYEILANAVTPLWKTAYSQQLNIKQHWCNRVVKEIKNVKKIKKVHSIAASPLETEYRNKDEFSVRRGIDGNPKTVGFFIGSHKEGNITCVPPKFLINIKKIHKKIAELYQDLIRKSPLRPCHDLHDGGYWRNVVVQSNSKGDSVVSVIAHPKGASESDINESKKDLQQHFGTSDANLKCLYFQLCPHTRCSGESYPFEVLYGEPNFFEEINGYQFRISPDSFFQVNTSLLPVMFETILNFVDPSDSTTLLDLCCGVGTLSILSSKRMRGCIGIEISPGAVKDADYNVKINNINNCHFIQGRIEEKLQLCLRNLEFSPRIVAVLNPGRAGIGQSGIKALRKCFQLDTLVYVSCQADHFAVTRNFQHLCCPKFDSSPPFVLTDVKPFDMFPQTNHCELVLLFKR